ncbi:MAG: hypothetical protein ACM3VS_14230 [Candidatus Dadabacteria bacterium]
MSERIHALAQILVGKASINDCNLEEIERIVEEYPYFAPAQFLLLEKLKQEGSKAYTKQLQKAVLFYHNPVLFQQFISSQPFYVEPRTIRENESAEINSHEITEAPSAIESTELNEGFPSDESTSEHTGEETGSNVEVIEEGFSQEANVDQNNFAIEEGEQAPLGIQEAPGSGEIIEPPLELHNVSAAGLNEFYPPFIEPQEKEEINPTEVQEEDVNESFEQGNPENKIQAPVVEVNETGTEGNLDKPSENQASASLNAVQPEDASADISFEPYHTVDYFASQGIKVVAEDVPKDKFGKQLKSFTEWLKTMKRLPANEPPKTVDSNLETKVASLANQSVNDSEIVTEAMAEVWLKQGNKEKALEIYNKLVLLDPSKKAFFAGKIENLKNL